MTKEERADFMDVCNELSIEHDGVRVVPLDDLIFYLEEIKTEEQDDKARDNSLSAALTVVQND